MPYKTIEVLYRVKKILYIFFYVVRRLTIFLPLLFFLPAFLSILERFVISSSNVPNIGLYIVCVRCRSKKFRVNRLRIRAKMKLLQFFAEIIWNLFNFKHRSFLQEIVNAAYLITYVTGR